MIDKEGKIAALWSTVRCMQPFMSSRPATEWGRVTLRQWRFSRVVPP